jgi:hypothetical protein
MAAKQGPTVLLRAAVNRTSCIVCGDGQPETPSPLFRSGSHEMLATSCRSAQECMQERYLDLLDLSNCSHPFLANGCMWVAICCRMGR